MSKTLLLADDSVVIQKLVGLSFANEDVEIVTTDNGDDAVVKAREVTPDVVLADVVMPGKSGYEVCEEIKQDPALAHIPVLLLTGTFEAFDEAQAEAAGADGQITKPFEAQALVARITEIMNAPRPVAEEAPASETTSETSDYDFFDSEASNLSDETSQPAISASPSTTEETPAISARDTILFGDPGGAGADELDSDGGGLALGESVADDLEVPADDATVAILPDSPPPLPPSAGDPLDGFEADLDLADLAQTPPPIPVDLGSALDSVPSDPGATIVAAVDDTNAATSPNIQNPTHDLDFGATPALDDTIDDLTVHTPSSAIDQDVATAPSPEAAGGDALSAQGEATVVANLDISLAEPASAEPPARPKPLDLGPTDMPADELDFAFDVSEQAPVTDTQDPLGDSFSSLMDISESQILAGPPESVSIAMDAAAARSLPDDSIAAGYDVSSSDLATADAPKAAAEEASEQTGSRELIDDAIPTALDLDSEDRERDADVPSTSDNISDNISGNTPDMGIDLSDAQHGSAHHPMARPEALELAAPIAGSADDDRIADLSPIVEQRIQETLEKVAWEAFSDLSETIVKQVIGRVEKIAWEVIPQMAETLVREEIRKMKGEKD